MIVDVTNELQKDQNQFTENRIFTEILQRWLGNAKMVPSCWECFDQCNSNNSKKKIGREIADKARKREHKNWNLPET